MTTTRLSTLAACVAGFLLILGLMTIARGGGVDAGPPEVGAASAEPAAAAPAPASAATPDDSDVLADQLRDVLAGDNLGRAIASVMLIGLVFVVRKYGTSGLPIVGWRFLPSWFGTDRGGVALTFALAVAGAIGHALAADAPVDFKLFESALLVGLTAIGGYVGLRRLWKPKDAGAPV